MPLPDVPYLPVPQLLTPHAITGLRDRRARELLWIAMAATNDAQAMRQEPAGVTASPAPPVSIALGI
jgi:hypothetical protein